jgi:F0F1-type ATP synthase membrane subunit b/b'
MHNQVQKGVEEARSSWDISKKKASDAVDDAMNQARETYQNAQTEFEQADRKAHQKADDIRRSV